MKKSKKICRTDATAILKFYSFEDGTFAFFYEVRKNGLVKYFVNCNGKVFGPYHKISQTAYKDENHFQFIYKKERDDDFSFYNLNGNDCKKII